MVPKKDQKKVKKTLRKEDKKSLPTESLGGDKQDVKRELTESKNKIIKEGEKILNNNEPNTRGVNFKDQLAESNVAIYEELEPLIGSGGKKTIFKSSGKATLLKTPAKPGSQQATSRFSTRTGSGGSSPRQKSLYSTFSEQSSCMSEMSTEEDIINLIVPETSQKIVHCLIGKDLFVDKTWCMVKKKDILEDVAIQDANSPFFPFTQKILQYKPGELLIGYEPFSEVPNQFMLCLTETGRDDVLSRLETLKSTYISRIEQSKVVIPKKWESLGSEEFVNDFQIKNMRKPISLEWIGDVTKRCFTEPKFEDCDPDAMKNGYTCLVPTDKERFELVYKRTQETGIQAVAQKSEASAQTEPEIPTNASTQYAPETEIPVPDTDVTRTAIKTQDLNTFFNKYLDYLLECLNYNEVYDLYHDDYPALYVAGEESQVQQFGTYHQYQSFTDVAAIEGKLVISSSWHPNYTGIVAVAYANEIPFLMKELEFDSDQTDYEEEKTDEEGELGEEPDLGPGARDWLEEERKERESTAENTELYDQAVKRLKDIESAKIIWETKIQEGEDETRKPLDDESIKQLEMYEYREYKEPEPELEVEEEIMTEVLEAQEEGEEQEETFGVLGKEDTFSPKTSKASFREQLEADTQDPPVEIETKSLPVEEEESIASQVQDSGSALLQPHTFSRSTSEGRRTFSGDPARKRSHHRKKHRKIVPLDGKRSQQMDQESSIAFQSTSQASSLFSDFLKPNKYAQEPEQFDEVTDEEEIKEKQDELPLLELNNPVLVWSFVDDLTPKLRLDSPYEVRTVEFNRDNGNLIAGGTASGQIVLWDITGRIEQLEKPEPLTQNQQKFRKRMEDLMKWRRDTRSNRRVRISAISNQRESHIERITDLKWVRPTVVVKDNFEVIPNPSALPNLQIITCSVYGDIKVWNLRDEPIKTDKKQLQQFKTKDRFGRPASLDFGLSPFNKLYRRWKPFISIMTNNKNLPVLLTGIDPHYLPIKYVRVTPRILGVKEVLEDRIEYKAVVGDFVEFPYHIYISNLFGKAGTLVWEPPEMKPPEGGNFPHTCRFWDSYHDGPIHRISKHPFLISVCLTVGGHVWAIWHSANNEEPILTKRYHGVYVTDGIWSNLRPSLIRIARSDGVVEIWDVIIQSHAPATTINVSGRVITNLSPPLLPELRGLLGIADYNSAFRLFYIPQQFRVWTENEMDRFKKFINREPERKKKMKEWSKWWRENNVNPEREEKKQAEEKKKLDEEVRLEKEKQEVARKKYNEEVYKWYMRRRGKPFLWREEAEEKWREKQEEHMHEMVMAKKKIDRNEMEILMRPIMREERNEAQKHGKAQERLKQADTIFRQTMELIFPKSTQKMSEQCKEEQTFSEELTKIIDYYNGENFQKLADEQESIIQRSPWQFDFEWSELLEKYNSLRMLFNDRRRKRSKTLRWLRKKLREELLKEGRRVHIRKSHTARYQKRKIKRRQEHLDWLKQTYGDDYNVYWDTHHPCRRFADRKFRFPLEEGDSQFLGELSEPDVEDEEIPELFTEGRAKSSLEMITEVGIENILEEAFAADLDAALITLESRESLGKKNIPSLLHKSSKEKFISFLDKKEIIEIVPFPYNETHLQNSEFLTVTVPSGQQSPQDDSDVSMVLDEIDDSSPLVDNQMQELDYIQQPIGTKIETLQTKAVASDTKREFSEGINIKVETSGSEEEEDEMENIIDEDIAMVEGNEIEDQYEDGEQDEDQELQDEEVSLTEELQDN